MTFHLFGCQSQNDPGDIHNMTNFQCHVSCAEAVVTLCLIPLIIFFNVPVILAPLFWAKLRTPDNILMVNLCGANLMSGIISAPMRIIARQRGAIGIDGMEEHKFTCFLLIAFEILPPGLILITLDCMSLDKFFAVRYPLRYKMKVGARESVISIVLIWTFCVVVTSMSFIDFRFNEKIDPLSQRCNIRTNIAPAQLWFWASIAIISVVFNTTATLYIANKSKQAKRKIKAFGSTIKRSKVVSLYSVTIVLWLFEGISTVAAVASDHHDFVHLAATIAWILILLDATVNAPIFAFVRDRNRLAYKYMVTSWPWHWPKLSHHMAIQEYRKYSFNTPSKSQGSRVSPSSALASSRSSFSSRKSDNNERTRNVLSLKLSNIFDKAENDSEKDLSPSKTFKQLTFKLDKL